MDENRAMHQDIRPIYILILNLMPLKEETELQLLRSDVYKRQEYAADCHCCGALSKV